MQEKNVETVNEFFARVLNAGDLASLEAISHGDLAVPQGSPGVEGLKRMLAESRKTFSNPEYKILDTVVEGQKVVVRFSAKATHSGRFMGLPATGRSVKLWGVMIFRFDAGGLAEYWSLLDAPPILAQLRA